MLLVCASFPLLICLIVSRNSEVLAETSYQKSFGTLTQDLTNSSLHPLSKYQTAISLLNMQLKMTVLVVLRDYPGVVIPLFYAQSIVYQSLILSVKPYLANKLELFNDILSSVYLIADFLLSDMTFEYP